MTPKNTKLLDRNVIIVKIKRDNNEVNFNGDTCDILCQKLKITPGVDTLGYQVIFSRGNFLVEIWLKPAIPAVNFSNDVHWDLSDGLTVIGVHPALSVEVPLLVKDLPFNFPDEEIQNYVARFGGVVSKPPTMVVYTSGKWKGQSTGERRYRADFSAQRIPMGSFHSIKGTHFKVTYRGNTPTCGRCHGSPAQCPGGGIASRCQEKGGPKVALDTHLKEVFRKLEGLAHHQTPAASPLLQGNSGSQSTKPPPPPWPPLTTHLLPPPVS